MGMAKYPGLPFSRRLLEARHWVADIVYFPADTELLQVARGLGCPATTVDTHDDLVKVLDEVVPTLAARAEQLVLEVAVVPETTFAP